MPLDESRHRTKSAIVLVVFAALTAWKLATHEPWRDELQAWMLARDSADLTELLAAARYECTPVGWHLLLFAASRLSPAPWVMQALHGVIAFLTAALVLRRAPFPFTARLLLIFGYFPFYEYNTLSRSYGLGALLLVGACVFAARRPRPLVAVGACLAAAALTSAHGALIAVAVALGVAVDEVRGRGGDGSDGGSRRGALVGAGLLVVALAATLVQGLPPVDHGVDQPWRTDFDRARAEETLGTAWRALVPLPRPGFHFWESNVLDTVDGGATVQAALGLVLVLAVVWVLRRDRSAALAWLVGVGAYWVFAYGKFVGYQRHHGHLFLLLLAVCWLASARIKWSALARRVLGAGLLVHVVAGAYATGQDLVAPFSAGERAAAFLRAEGLDDAPMVGHLDFVASTLAAHLDRPIHYASNDAEGTYIVWRDDRIDPSVHEVVVVARRIRDVERVDVLLVLSTELTSATPEIEPVAHFGESIVEDEVYWIYRLPAPP